MSGMRNLERGIAQSRGLAERVPTPSRQWLGDQRGRLIAVREQMQQLTNEAREGEAAIQRGHVARLAKIRSRYFGEEKRIAMQIAQRERADALREHLEAAQERLSALGLEAAKMLKAAEEVGDRHVTPAAMLRTATNGPNGRELTPVDAATYRSAKLAEFGALGPKAFREELQAAVDAGDLVAIGAACSSLERRDDVGLTGNDVVAAVELPKELRERVEHLREVENAGGQVLAAWAEWAEPDVPLLGTGQGRIASSLAGGSRIGEFRRLAALTPDQMRDLTGGEPEPTGPTGGALLDAVIGGRA